MGRAIDRPSPAGGAHPCHGYAHSTPRTHQRRRGRYSPTSSPATAQPGRWSRPWLTHPHSCRATSIRAVPRDEASETAWHSARRSHSPSRSGSGCQVCQQAHTAVGQAAGLTAVDIGLARQGTATDAREAALLTYAIRVLTEPSSIIDADVEDRHPARPPDRYPGPPRLPRGTAHPAPAPVLAVEGRARRTAAHRPARPAIDHTMTTVPRAPTGELAGEQPGRPADRSRPPTTHTRPRSAHQPL